MIKHTIHLLLLVILLALPGVSLAKRAGVVASVKSGDMVCIKNISGLMQNVRLYGIDAPGSSQPFSDKSRRMLHAMVSGKNVTYQVTDESNDGSVVALLYLDNISINGAMVKAGYAWVHPSCKQELSTSWTGYQNFAQQKKRGLWQQQNPVAPWKWRADRKELFAYADKWESGGAVSYEKSPDIRDSKRRVVSKTRVSKSSERRRRST